MDANSALPLPWTEATAAVDAAPSLLLVTHLNPDGDAIGSLVGLGNALIARGRAVTMAVDGGVPGYLQFIPGSDAVQGHLRAGDYALMISLDASDEERTGHTGSYGRKHSAQVINVDHHPTNTRFGDIHLVKPTAVSTTEIVQEWLDAMGAPLTREIAIPLLTGLVTDTIGFRISNVTGYTLSLAQRLMEVGASLTEITQRTLGSTPFTTIELWKEALQTVTLQDGVIAAIVTKASWKNAKLDEQTDAGLVQFLNTVDEARIAVVFKETGDGQVEISFRSKPGYDVGSVALAVGGGGHTQASGTTMRGKIDAVMAQVMPLLHAAVAQGTLRIG